jgi:hypothetical protein
MNMVVLYLSIACFLFSIICLFISLRILYKFREVLPTVKRFKNLEESVVRSVMEEGGDASAEAYTRILAAIRKDTNLLSSRVLDETKEIWLTSCKRKL